MELHALLGRSARQRGVALTKEGMTMKKIDIFKLPELATKVGIHGSVKQREIGGTGCGGIFIALVTG
jgi:hypothetical protein